MSGPDQGTRARVKLKPYGAWTAHTDLRRGLADGHGTARSGVEGDIDTAIRELEGISCFLRVQGQYGTGQQGGCNQGLSHLFRPVRWDRQGRDAKRNAAGRPRQVSRPGTPRPVVVSCPSAGLLTGGSPHLSPSRDDPSGIREALAAYSCGGSSVSWPRPERIPFSFPKETDTEISGRVCGPRQAPHEPPHCQSQEPPALPFEALAGYGNKGSERACGGAASLFPTGGELLSSEQAADSPELPVALNVPNA